MKNGDTLQETAAKGVEAIHTIVKERDELLVGHDRMKTDIALLRQKCAQLESRLDSAQHERDHYMRFATTLVSDLNNIQGIIHSAVASAKAEAFAPPAVPPPKKDVPQISAKHVDQLASLIKRLPQNGGEVEPRD
jgi:hypothetical protein